MAYARRRNVAVCVAVETTDGARLGAFPRIESGLICGRRGARMNASDGCRLIGRDAVVPDQSEAHMDAYRWGSFRRPVDL